jgi:Protein of unknown function (DUF4058)
MAESPFPGMDPYLETDWLDVHTRLVNLICDQLQEQLPEDLCARMESRVLVEDENDEGLQPQHPDVRVVELGGRNGGTAVLESPRIAGVEPDLYVAEARGEPATQRHIEIVDVQTRTRVVSTLELISPSNKRRGDGQQQYLAKREECLEAGVNVVEIDLTRGGNRYSILPQLETVVPPTNYVACVRRPGIDDLIAVYLLPLDKPLKPMRIPLRPKDADVVLDLQPLVKQAYARGRYDRLDYSRPLDPPPDKEEAAIIERFLQQAGKLGAP